MNKVPVMDEEPFLQVRHVSKRFGEGCDYCLGGGELERNICPKCKTVHAVRDVSLDLYPGEIVGIVGESGSGKSTFMQCLYFDQVATAGTVRAVAYDGGEANLLELSSQQKRKVRNAVLGMVYQNPYLGLRMNFSSLSNIAEQMIAAGNRSVESMRARGNELLGKVNIPFRVQGMRRQRFPAACSSAFRLPRRFRTTRPCCFWMKLPRVSIFPCRPAFLI